MTEQEIEETGLILAKRLTRVLNEFFDENPDHEEISPHIMTVAMVQVMAGHVGCMQMEPDCAHQYLEQIYEDIYYNFQDFENWKKNKGKPTLRVVK